MAEDDMEIAWNCPTRLGRNLAAVQHASNASLTRQLRSTLEHKNSVLFFLILWLLSCACSPNMLKMNNHPGVTKLCPGCFNVLRTKAMAQHYLNQVASTWDRLDPCIPEPEMSRHSELRSFQITPKHRLWMTMDSKNLQQFRETRCFMVSVCNDVFFRSAACFDFHPSMDSGTQNAGFTASLLIPAEDFQDTLVICCMAR